MGRRKKSSPLEDVLDLLAMLPWVFCAAIGCSCDRRQSRESELRPDIASTTRDPANQGGFVIERR